MTSIGTSARTTVAAAAAALLLVVGCDDGADQSTPPEAPAEQETRAAQEEPAAGEEPSGSDEDAAGAEQDTGTDGEQDPEGTPDDGSAEPITDPCSDLTPEDVGAVLGNEVDGPMGTADVEAPEGVESEGVVACQFGPTDPGDSGASMHWLAPTMDYPDEMPEEVREEQEESWRIQTIGSGEEIEVEGASAARVEIADASGFTHLTVRAIVGDVVLWSAVFGPEGTLDESDIPSAAEMAELAISKA